MDVAKLVCVCFVFYIQASCGNIARNLKTDELIQETAKRLSRLFDDVEELKNGMTFITNQLSDGKYTGFPHVPEQTKTDGAHVTITQLGETEVEIRVDHSWDNLKYITWVSSTFAVLPGERYLQEIQPGYIAIFLPLNDIKSDDVFPGPLISLYVMQDLDYYGFEFDVLAALKSPNKTSDDRSIYGHVREDLSLFPISVSPSQSISYNPGDVIDVKFQLPPGDVRGSEVNFHSVSADPSESIAVSYSLRGDLEDTPFSLPEGSLSHFRVDTTTLATGGIFSVSARFRKPSDIVLYYAPFKLISLIPQNYNAPIPRDRVAIVGYPYGNQTLSLSLDTNPVRCEAFGNPTPHLEIRLNGHTIRTLSAEWAWEYGSLVTVYDIPGDDLVKEQVTCYARSGDGEAEMPISFKYELIVLPELSTVSRYAGYKTEVTCAFKGKPAPKISFYKNAMRDSNLLSPDGEFIQIDRFQNGTVSKATLVYNSSEITEIWGVECVAESNGQTRTKYVFVG